jgi:hypothetical protein
VQLEARRQAELLQYPVLVRPKLAPDLPIGHIVDQSAKLVFT